MRNDVAVAYLRDQTEILTGVRPERDENGDLTIDVDGVRLWLRVRGEQGAAVRFTGVAADDVLMTTTLQRWVNESNGRMSFGRLWAADRSLRVGTELWAEDLTPSLISRTVRHLAQETRRLAAEFHAVSGARPRTAAPQPREALTPQRATAS